MEVHTDQTNVATVEKKYNTIANYKFVQNVLAKETIGQKKINNVRLLDAMLFLIKFQNEGRGYSFIHMIRGESPAFQMAVDDKILVRNPFEF